MDWRELWRTILRSAAGTAPVMLVSFLYWYVRQGYDWEHHLEIAGLVAIAMLTVLAFVTLHPRYWHRCGRLAVASYATWTCGAVVFRILSLANVITAEQRLTANSIIAIVLVIAGVYVLFVNVWMAEVWAYIRGIGS